MLRKEFETWPTDSLPNATLGIVDIYVTNLGYLEDRSPRFTELPEGGMGESNKMLTGLEIASFISETDN